MRVEVNLNAITGDLLVRVGRQHFPEPPVAGMEFTAFDPGDAVEGPARVVRASDRNDIVFVAVEWDRLRDMQPADRMTA